MGIEKKPYARPFVVTCVVGEGVVMLGCTGRGVQCPNVPRQCCALDISLCLQPLPLCVP